MKGNIKSILTTTAIIMAGVMTTTAHVSAFSNVDEQRKLGFTGEISKFNLKRPAGVAASCASKARGVVRVIGGEEAELLEVKVWGMPKNSEVDIFSIQVPGFPFGMSWYIGDIQTDSKGFGYAKFIGRFNEETFVVAPDVAPAPLTHDKPIADAGYNPATAPIHTYHIGVWFNSPQDAVKSGCAGATTPFNGEHNAGVQVLNTGQFPAEAGPLLDATLPK